VRVTWSSNVGARGAVDLAAGQRFVVARRMDLPGDRLVTSVPGQDHLVLVRLPYVSDPALVVTATDRQPALFRGQRANGAIVEVRSPHGDTTVPAAGQHLSLPHERTEVVLRYPDLVLSVEVEADPAPAETAPPASRSRKPRRDTPRAAGGRSRKAPAAQPAPAQQPASIGRTPFTAAPRRSTRRRAGTRAPPTPTSTRPRSPPASPTA